jgi:hypothetical protein
VSAFFIGGPLNNIQTQQTKFEAQQSDLAKTVSSIQTQQTKFEAQQSDLVKSVSSIQTQQIKFEAQQSDLVKTVGIASGVIVAFLVAFGSVVDILEYLDKKEDQKLNYKESNEKM